MNLYEILGRLDAGNFSTIESFSDFTKMYLEFIAEGGMQAEIMNKKRRSSNMLLRIFMIL